MINSAINLIEQIEANYNEQTAKDPTNRLQQYSWKRRSINPMRKNLQVIKEDQKRE